MLSDNKKYGAVKNQKPRSLEIWCSSRDCAIGKVGKKDCVGFRRLVGRAISDSKVIKARWTKEKLFLFEVLSMGI